MKLSTILFVVYLFSCVVIAQNIQPILITNNDSFTDARIIVSNWTHTIYEETFLSSSTRTTAIVYLSGFNSSYQQNVNYSVSLNVSGDWQNIDGLNNTVGYFGRGNNFNDNGYGMWSNTSDSYFGYVGDL